MHWAVRQVRPFPAFHDLRSCRDAEFGLLPFVALQQFHYDLVIAMREREGRTLPFIGMSEGEGVALANENVSRLSTMSADEASHCDELHMSHHVDRVNHSEIYSDHGKHTNMVESFSSRLRNMVQCQHHHVSPQYLHQYANHAAWLEDNRRTPNGTLAHIMVSNSMEAPVSRNWKGYWQRAISARFLISP